MKSPIRGLAYLQLGDGHHASVEFQKVIDHPGLIRMDVIGVLSHLQMARARTLPGDRASALKSYADFLDQWKSADPDIPVYKHVFVNISPRYRNEEGQRHRSCAQNYLKNIGVFRSSIMPGSDLF